MYIIFKVGYPNSVILLKSTVVVTFQEYNVHWQFQVFQLDGHVVLSTLHFGHLRQYNASIVPHDTVICRAGNAAYLGIWNLKEQTSNVRVRMWTRTWMLFWPQLLNRPDLSVCKHDSLCHCNWRLLARWTYPTGHKNKIPILAYRIHWPKFVNFLNPDLFNDSVSHGIALKHQRARKKN